MASISSHTVLLGQSEREYILEGCRQDCRLDGRTCQEVRPYVIVTPTATQEAPLILSHGSARLLSANSCSDGESTQLLCSVKAELTQPTALRPDQGMVELHVDAMVAGISRRLCDDLQASLMHLLGDSLVDTRALCVLPNVYAWRLHIDVYVVSQAGSLLDAASRVVRAALENTKLPALDVLPATSHESIHQETAEMTQAASVVVDGDIHNASPLPGVDAGPLIVTVTVMQSLDANHRPVTTLLLDATAAEEACAMVQVHLAVVTTPPAIAAVRKTGTGSLSLALLPEITKLALHAASQNDNAYTRKCSSEPSSAWLLQGLYELE